MPVDPASTPREGLEGPEADQDESTDASALEMATGVYVGVAIGLVIWVAAILLAWLVMVLA